MAMTTALREEIQAEVTERCGVQLTSPEAIRRSVTASGLRRLIASGVGGGMLELYWLKTMDPVRTWPALHEVNVSLIASTWGTNKGTFKARSAEERIGAGQELVIYADRANLRLPAHALPYCELQSKCQLFFRIFD